MKMSGKVVVLTGAVSGMGRELVRALLARGARVAAVDVREEGLDELERASGAGEQLSTHVVDVTDREAVRALPAQVVAHHGIINVLINNAGVIQPFERVHEL